MLHRPQILIQQLNYSTNDNKSIFNDLMLSFVQKKTAIAGRNGIGKSTLLKIIVGNLQPVSGNINLSGTISYCPQNLSSHLNKTVSEALGVTEKLAALERIEQGSVDTQDFEIASEDWDLKSQLENQLRLFKLADIELNRQLSSISGGELTRLYLAKVFFENSDFIILDEPTNNLDLTSKQLLYEAIKRWNKGLIVVSHDRYLLGLMEQIIELTSIGAKVYGGNYEHYIEQKALAYTAISRQLNDAKKQINKTKETIQASREKHEQREAKGNRTRKSGGQSKLILDSMKERSDKTKGKLSTKEERLLKDAKIQMQEAKKKIEIINQIKIDLPKTYVPSHKMIATLEKVTFIYEEQTKPIVNNFSLVISGHERIALLGNNGSGKTTLVKLIQGILKPFQGEINIGASRVSYLDQNTSILNPELTILENYKQHNPEIKETDARFNLADFLFRNIDALKKVSNLSGGEKLRAALACVLTSAHPPQLLILDEPTNHLDLESITALESALSCYQGALIIISHDMQFIENVGVVRMIDL